MTAKSKVAKKIPQRRKTARTKTVSARRRAARPKQAIERRTVAPRGEQTHVEYLALAAHELRSPLASLLGFSELLLNFEFDEPTRRDFLESIQLQAGRLNRLINDLVDLATLETKGVAMMKMAAGNLDAIAHAAVEVFQNGNAGAVIAEDWHADLPAIACDRLWVERMVTNLLENAVKFSAWGAGVRIATVVDGKGARRRAGIRVEDDGVGIEDEDLAHIGEKFYRGKTVDARPGNGLGLALVKVIAACHGGSMTIESRFGEGSAVTLWFR